MRFKKKWLKQIRFAADGLGIGFGIIALIFGNIPMKLLGIIFLIVFIPDAAYNFMMEG